MRRALDRENAKRPVHLALVPESECGVDDQRNRIEVWRSRDFLVQVFKDGETERLSVCRTSVDSMTGRWLDGITWDDLQRLKRECGRGDRMAVEIFPADLDVVNVANMRHLWVLAQPLPFGWSKTAKGVA